MCFVCHCHTYFFFLFKQKTAYEMRISDWSSDVCSSDLEDVTLSCSGADGCVAAPCGGFSFIDEVSLPLEFFALPTPPPLPEGPLGRRRFSIDQIGRASCRERVWQYV